MCSGLRSSSAKGAIALRAASACSWSTSSNRVLSDWTIRGPSFITGQLYGPGVGGVVVELPLALGRGAPAQGAELLDRALAHLPGAAERPGADALRRVDVR